MIKRICKNCVYFHNSSTIIHPIKTYGKGFGGCGVTFEWDKKNENDTCIDFSTEDKMYTTNKKSMPKKGIFARFRDLLVDIKDISEAQLEYWDKEWEKMRGIKNK